MSDVLAYYPTAASPTRTIFRDSAWSGAIDSSIFHGAPILARHSNVGDVVADLDDFFDYSSSNYTENLNSGTATLSTSLPGGVLDIAPDLGFAPLDTCIMRKFVWFLNGTNILYHETQLSVSSATLGTLFVGFTNGDTSPLVSTPDKGFWFYKNSNDATIRTGHFMALAAQAFNGTGPAFNYQLTADTMTRFGIIATTEGVDFYINGIPCQSHRTANLNVSTDTAYRWTCSMQVGAEAVTHHIDYQYSLQGPP